MAVNRSPIFTEGVNFATAKVTTATGATSLGPSAPSNIVLLAKAGDTHTVGPHGGNLRRVKCVSQKTTAATAKIIRLFLHDGTDYHLFHEIEIAAGAGTPSATQITKDSGWVDLDVNLPADADVYAASTVSENAVVIAEIGDFEKAE